MRTMLHSLPPEIMWHITGYLSLDDLAVARLVSKQLRHFCDHPSFWRDLRLEPAGQPNNNSSNTTTTTSTMALWQLSDLKRLVEPHVRHIRSIRIWGVRDTIVQYLLEQCPNLTDLTVCGWTTLSSHAFGKLNRTLALRRLELIGAAQQPNFAAIDARQLGRLLHQCPDLSDLMLGCQIHIHARTLLKELKRHPRAGQRLQLLTLASRRTWSHRHVAELLQLCPQLECVCLVPAAAKGFDLRKDDLHHWVKSKPHVELESATEGEDELATDMVSDMVITRSILSLSDDKTTAAATTTTTTATTTTTTTIA
ncbi:hypothetical protein BCR43DRAFT_481176 [Syncephalastrum racemosum]|uniref:F-box domain-containing protein n=1 Tax=Syncephalastrum racemosum TaxID=13706 RepID=A0A1X2HSW5_SYNRA|nr:hypothetical protein BCR43DRAFT_481176 [Syncephalastrum racemosum]